MRNNRSLYIVIVALAWSVAAQTFGGERGSGSTQVKIGRAEVRFIGDVAVLRAKCLSPDAYGCTVFAEERLVTVCTVSADGWRIDAAAQWKPLIYVGSASYEEHEMLHVADVRRMASAHILQLEQERFGTKSDCERRAESTRAAFPAFMNGFLARSNVVMH